MTPTGPAYTYRATCLRVIDGDTLVADIDLGFEVHAAVHIRIRKVNAPELHGSSAVEGIAARQFLADLIAAPRPLLLQSYGRSFERWAADVWARVGAGWESVAELIVAAGHGEPIP